MHCEFNFFHEERSVATLCSQHNIAHFRNSIQFVLNLKNVYSVNSKTYFRIYCSNFCRFVRTSSNNKHFAKNYKIVYQKMYELDIESEFRAVSFYDDEQKIRFDPPVYEQRYSTVIRILELERWTKHLKKVRNLELSPLWVILIRYSHTGGWVWMCRNANALPNENNSVDSAHCWGKYRYNKVKKKLTPSFFPLQKSNYSKFLTVTLGIYFNLSEVMYTQSSVCVHDNFACIFV